MFQINGARLRWDDPSRICPVAILALHGLRDHITATVWPKRKRTKSKEEIRRCAWSRRRKVVSELLSD